MNKKGFTIVELLTSIVLVTAVSLFLLQIAFGLLP